MEKKIDMMARAYEMFKTLVELDEEERKSEAKRQPYQWTEGDKDMIAFLFVGFKEAERKAYNGEQKYYFTDNEMYYLELALSQVEDKGMSQLLELNKKGVCTVSDWRNKSTMINKLRELAQGAKERDKVETISENDLPVWLRR